MLDLKYLRDNLEEAAKRLAIRGFKLDVDTIKTLEKKRRQILQQCENLQMQRNSLAKEIGIAKKSGVDCQDLLDKAAAISHAVKTAEQDSKACEQQLLEIVSYLPNLPDHSVPKGKDENDNVVLRVVGQKRSFDFPVKDHETIATAQGIDMELGAKLAGSRFSVLKGEVAQLNRALSQWMLDTHTSAHGYTEIHVPVLTKPETLFGTGQLPKFKDDLFITNDERELSLIPTAEVQLVNIVADEILDEASLPLSFCAHSQCFRKEAGSYGKDTKGMFRVHQFEKVELVQIVKPADSYAALETITGHAEHILQALELPYRVVALCGGDLGFGASKTYDIEVWLPSQNQYREISSCSNTEDFQARRIKARYRGHDKKTQLVHALNASGVAVGRLLIAVLENHQTKAGTVTVPTVLQPYMQDKKEILVS